MTVKELIEYFETQPEDEEVICYAPMLGNLHILDIYDTEIQVGTYEDQQEYLNQ